MSKKTNVTNRTYIQVQIPEELAKYVSQQTTDQVGTQHLINVIGFFLLLKEESPGSSLIQDYFKQSVTLSRNFNISQPTFFSYVNELESMKLAILDGNNLRIAPWHRLGDTLGIKTNKRIQSHFIYSGEQNIDWWFAALENRESK